MTIHHQVSDVRLFNFSLFKIIFVASIVEYKTCDHNDRGLKTEEGLNGYLFEVSCK